jgi:fructose-1,6-bisphosphatase/inositol monophosphatase family enzyme
LSASAEAARFGRRELAEVAALVRTVARGEIMSRFRRLGEGGVRAKTGPLDLVTEADEAAEARLTEGLERLFPGCAVVGEEAASRHASVLDRIGTADLAFAVDPVDGTANFVAGVPLFGVIVAAVAGGDVIGAVIHDPVGDDAALALAGQGAWIEAADGSRAALRVAAPAPLAATTAMVSWRFMPEPRRGTVCRNLPRLAAAWDYRCAAAQYRMAAGGHVHALVYERLMPWDHAAGWLLHREAGGFSARFDGSPYGPAHIDGGLICAPDEATWRAVRDALLTAVA